MPDQDEGPKPGHFLPGGAGDGAPEPEPRRPHQPSLGQPRDVTSPYSRPSHQPSQQPGWHSQQLPPRPPRRRLPLIAALVAGSLVVVAGIVFASTKLISSFDSIAEQPLSGRTADPSEPAPLATEPSPTVTVTAPPPSDTQIVRQNKLYAATLVASCKEPGFEPTTQKAVAAYIRGLLTCLDRAWAPLVRKTGNEFRSPKLVLFTAGERTCDAKPTDLGVYCYGEETVNFPWDRYVDEYKNAPTSTRVSLLADTAALYAFHVMNMVGLADAESGLEDAAASEAARNQLQRRYHLQGDCLGATFVGAIRGSFPIQGRTLDRWKAYTTSLVVDDPKTTGSRRNLILWLRRGFAGGLKVCNTWVAPAKEVS
jgi:uncharacterized protein